MQTFLDYVKQVLGDNKKMKVVLVVLSAAGLLSLIAIQILPFLIFLLLAIIVYLQIPKDK